MGKCAEVQSVLFPFPNILFLPWTALFSPSRHPFVYISAQETKFIYLELVAEKGFNVGLLKYSADFKAFLVNFRFPALSSQTAVLSPLASQQLLIFSSLRSDIFVVISPRLVLRTRKWRTANRYNILKIILQIQPNQGLSISNLVSFCRGRKFSSELKLLE